MQEGSKHIDIDSGVAAGFTGDLVLNKEARAGEAPKTSADATKAPKGLVSKFCNLCI